MQPANSSRWASSPSAPLSISVVMPAYNAPHYLRISLPPLAQMLQAGEIAELIVVDDCSTDDTVEVARSFGARILKTPHNMGPGGARNLAAREAKGEVIWLVDADVVAKPGSGVLIAQALSDPEVAAVFGAYCEAPPAQAFWSQYKNLVHRYYHQRGERDASTFWAGCGALKRDAFLEVGGFDVARFKKPSVEDIELGYRLRAAGWRIVLDPELQATHLKNWTMGNVIHTDIFCRAIPWSRMLLERGKIDNDLNVSGAERVRALVAGAFFASFLLPFLVPFGWAAPVLMALLVLAANWSLFAFMARIRGALFALGAIAYHQVYYIYSAVVFVLCAVEHRFKAKGAPPAVPADRTA